MIRNIKRTRLGVVAAVLPLVSVLAACGGGGSNQSEPKTSGGLPVVRMDGVVPDPMSVPVMAVSELGLDKKYGFKFEYTEGDPAGGTTPFLRGDVELGPGDAISAAIANGEGFDTVAYYPFMSQTAGIVASAASGIKTPEDLVGKKVGHFGDDSGTTQAIALTLKDGWGIDVNKDMTLVQSKPEVLPELLASGEVDAIFDFEPFLDRGVQASNGVRVLDVAKYWGDKENWVPPLAMLWSNRDWITKNPDLAKNVVKAFTEAQQTIIDSNYAMFRKEPYASFLDLADSAEMDRLIKYCQGLPCYTNTWSDQDAQKMNDWIQNMVDAGMLDSFPENPPAQTLDQVLGSS